MAMSLYLHKDGDVLAAITSPGFEFARDIAHEQGIDLGVVLLGDKANNPPSVVLLELPPGHVLERHAHNTRRMEVVVRGSIITADGRELRAGDVSLSDPGEFYGPLTAGSEGCLTVEVFADMGGMVPQVAHDASPEGAEQVAAIGKLARENLAG
jgi:hypothetical protein